jgi:hypothetical protein
VNINGGEVVSTINMNSTVYINIYILYRDIYIQ